MAEWDEPDEQTRNRKRDRRQYVNDQNGDQRPKKRVRVNDDRIPYVEEEGNDYMNDENEEGLAPGALISIKLVSTERGRIVGSNKFVFKIEKFYVSHHVRFRF